VFTHDSSYDDETEGTKGGWKGLNTKYYWPESGVLSFGGYSPAGIQGTFTYNAAGLKIESFAIKTNAAEHQDLMYAERVYNKKNNTTDANNATYDGVDIAFKHALSSIQFKVQLSADYSSTFKLTSIKVGRVKYSGTFTENITEEFDEVDGKKTLKSSENNPSWSVADNQILNTTPYVAFSGSVQLNKNTGDDAKNYINQYLALDGVDGQNDLILMPQVLPDEAELEIVYTVNGKEESSTVKLSDLNIKEWVMGQRYTYNITLGYDLILVGATVKNWDEEDDVNIPIN
jgi:hypothetical protein